MLDREGERKGKSFSIQGISTCEGIKSYNTEERSTHPREEH
jgi:hypothetical protein